MPKIISVNKANKSFLEKALNSAGVGFVWGAGVKLGQDAYDQVKRFLKINGVPHSEHDSKATIHENDVHH